MTPCCHPFSQRRSTDYFDIDRYMNSNLIIRKLLCVDIDLDVNHKKCFIKFFFFGFLATFLIFF